LKHEGGEFVSRTQHTENIPGYDFYYRLSLPQGDRAAGRIMAMKNFNDSIGNRTRNLPVCSELPQPTAPPGVRKY